MPELKLSGSLRPHEQEYFHKDGSRVHVHIGVASYDESPNAGVAFVLDLTERQRAEDARAEAELRQARNALVHR